MEGDRRGRPGQDRLDPSAGEEHERDGQDRRGEQRLHRDRGADAEAEPHGAPDRDLVAPPERERDGERGEREGGAVGRDRSGDPQARAGDAHEPGGDDRAVAVGDGPAGRVGGADQQQRRQHREHAWGVGGAKAQEVRGPEQGEEQGPLAREHVAERLAAGSHGDGRGAEDAVVEGEVALGDERRDAQPHREDAQEGQIRLDRPGAVSARSGRGDGGHRGSEATDRRRWSRGRRRASGIGWAPVTASLESLTEVSR